MGVRPFRATEQKIFFGREKEIGAVVDSWRRNRLTVLHGAAGVGKTSLLLAGVLPFLREQGAQVLPLGRVVHRPAFPMAALPEQNPLVFALLTSWCPDESPTRVGGRSILEVLHKRVGPDRSGRPRQIFVAIDEAELIFRESPRGGEHRERLCSELARLLAGSPELHLLIAVREDHRARVNELTARLSRDSRDFSGPGDIREVAEQAIEPFDRAAAVAAVRGPLEETGRAAAAGAARLLIEELRTIRLPGAPARTTSLIAPAILQMVCARLWAELSADVPAGQLADEVDRVLAEHCAQALATVAADHSLPPRELLHRFRAAFAGQQGGPGLPAEPLSRAVLHALQERHLIRGWPGTGAYRYELHHPRLIAAIDRLDDRLGAPRQPGPTARLRAAELAVADGDFDLARYHLEGAARACGEGDLRMLADVECFIGNIAYEQDRRSDAADYYERAASLYETLRDTAAVGWLLAAIGRLKMDDSAPEAVNALKKAAARLPNDMAVQTGLAQALWQAGQSHAALAVLDGVLSLDGAMPEALRSRGEIYADLGKAEPALRDLGRIDHDSRPSTQAAWALAHAMRHRRADLQLDQRALERTVSGGAGSGPVLLRVARVRQLYGNAEAAAGLAALAADARQPPLPPQLADEAYRLMHGAADLR